MKNTILLFTFLLMFLCPQYSHAASTMSRSATMPISVKIVANCNVAPERWCDERRKCCHVAKKEARMTRISSK